MWDVEVVAVEENFEACLRPFQIQSRYAAFMVWLAVFFKFFIGFQGLCSWTSAATPKANGCLILGIIWAYHVSAYCMTIRVDFNVWACVSVAIGRRCWFPIESNLFCREVHLHKMPAKNGVICTIRGYDLWDPLDGFGSHLWYQETSWMAASYRCRWEWFLSGLPADGEGKKTEKKMMVSIMQTKSSLLW